MRPQGRSATFALIALVIAAMSIGCRRAIVIVPQPSRAYTATDTLWGRYKGRDVRVTFYFDTIWRTETVTRTDTLWRAGTRTIVRVDTLLVQVPPPAPVYVPAPVPTPTPTSSPSPSPRPTTGRVPRVPSRVDTVTISRRDTVRVPGNDTIRIFVRDTVRITSIDTVRVTMRDTIRLTVRDTIRLIVRDTLRITVRDTLRITVRDTVVRVDSVRVAGRRMLFVPPGQYPPEGQCRVWVHDLPPGRQADAAPCNALGPIPAGAFILFRGEAWDFDYDWIGESRRSSVPVEIVALKRRGRP